MNYHPAFLVFRGGLPPKVDPDQQVAHKNLVAQLKPFIL